MTPKPPSTPKPRRSRARPAPPPHANIHQMRLNDIPEVFALGQRLFTAEKLPTLYRSWDEHELVQLFGTDEETCLVAESEDRIVGFALGRIMEKPRSAWRYGWLAWLGVDPKWHGSDAGRRLLEDLTNLFIDRDARIMLVDTDEDNHPALKFFRKHGFGQEMRHVYLSRNLDDHPRAIERRNGRQE